MLVDVNVNVKTFLSTILKLDQDMCLKVKINYIYNSLDSVDVDFCIPYLKKRGLFYKEIEDELVELIDYYYNNIEENINNFTFSNATTFLSTLERKAKTVQNYFDN